MKHNTNFTLLDGGMGQVLIKKAQRRPTPLWSADILIDRLDLVEEAHCDFLKAGADIITLSGYTVTPSRLARYNRRDDFIPLQSAAVEAARSASQKQETTPLIAGCLPPLTASYQPSQSLPYQDALDEYKQLVECQYKHVDLFICETMSNIQEASICTEVANTTKLPVWTSFTVDELDGSKLRSGELLVDGAQTVLDKGADAILINCSPPEVLCTSIDEIKHLGVQVGVQANGFQSVSPLATSDTVDALSVRDELGPNEYASFAKEYLAHGADIIGGCCEIGPHHIFKINQLRIKDK